VVETTNFADRAGVGMNDIVPSEALKITERFSRTSATAISYPITIDDPMTWTAPFTIRYPLKRDDGYGMFEYACHEGNYALQNILSGTRAGERSLAESPGDRSREHASVRSACEQLFHLRKHGPLLC
jgi:hypothetical protein